MEYLGQIILPLITVLIIIFGFIKKVPMFEAFLEGAKAGLINTFHIAPSLIALIVAVSMLRQSGALEMLCNFVSPILQPLGFPPQLLPMALLRPISGSGSTALLNSILQENGADSFIGRCASVMAGSTETTFYAIAVYYGAVGVKKMRHTIPAALLADFTGMVMAVLTVNLFFS